MPQAPARGASGPSRLVAGTIPMTERTASAVSSVTWTAPYEIRPERGPGGERGQQGRRRGFGRSGDGEVRRGPDRGDISTSGRPAGLLTLTPRTCTGSSWMAGRLRKFEGAVPGEGPVRGSVRTSIHGRGTPRTFSSRPTSGRSGRRTLRAGDRTQTSPGGRSRSGSPDRLARVEVDRAVAEVIRGGGVRPHREGQLAGGSAGPDRNGQGQGSGGAGANGSAANGSVVVASNGSRRDGRIGCLGAPRRPLGSRVGRLRPRPGVRCAARERRRPATRPGCAGAAQDRRSPGIGPRRTGGRGRARRREIRRTRCRRRVVFDREAVNAGPGAVRQRQRTHRAHEAVPTARRDPRRPRSRRRPGATSRMEARRRSDSASAASTATSCSRTRLCSRAHRGLIGRACAVRREPCRGSAYSPAR